MSSDKLKKDMEGQLHWIMPMIMFNIHWALTMV